MLYQDMPQAALYRSPSHLGIMAHGYHKIYKWKLYRLSVAVSGYNVNQNSMKANDDRILGYLVSSYGVEVMTEERKGLASPEAKLPIVHP